MYMYPIGIIAQLLALSLFIYFIYTVYLSGIQQQFMSLESNAGICESVLQPLTGTFTADTLGHWLGTSNYTYSLGIYVFDLQTFNGDNEDFAEMINTFEGTVQMLGEIATKQNLAINLLLWMAFGSSFSVGEYVQLFTLTGDPQAVFDRDYISGALSTVSYDCNATAIAQFDVSTYLLVSMI